MEYGTVMKISPLLQLRKTLKVQSAKLLPQPKDLQTETMTVKGKLHPSVITRVRPEAIHLMRRAQTVGLPGLRRCHLLMPTSHLFHPLLLKEMAIATCGTRCRRG